MWAEEELHVSPREDFRLHKTSAVEVFFKKKGLKAEKGVTKLSHTVRTSAGDRGASGPWDTTTKAESSRKMR